MHFFIIIYLLAYYHVGQNAVTIENEDNIGVIIGRIKRFQSDNETCISKLLVIIDNDPSSSISFVAAMDSDNSYMASLNGFDIFVNVVSTSREGLDVIINFLQEFNVDITL